MIPARLTHNAPASSLIKYWIGRIFMAITGWRVTGEVPPYKKFVLIGAHHTSNWDFPFGLAMTFIFRIKTQWMAKHTLFRWPMGIFMRALGGIAVDRKRSQGITEQMTQALEQADKMVIMIAPSGTRKKAPHWKSGFYRIAHQANVPIVCASLDFKHKVANIGLSLMPSGDVKKDMDRIREYYKDIQARYPDKVTPVRLAEE
ncbi:MAG: lysophospholipid acyltransferase family protein [Gammaproteobacteria bacterium]|jgi:1-acyl-sn-glycerol-3-phosphate acyltransferase|nr:lysophospholipid acyltransferase family protein [Gammaproteobacteria bacterium]